MSILLRENDVVNIDIDDVENFTVNPDEIEEPTVPEDSIENAADVSDEEADEMAKDVSLGGAAEDIADEEEKLTEATSKFLMKELNYLNENGELYSLTEKGAMAFGAVRNFMHNLFWKKVKSMYKKYETVINKWDSEISGSLEATPASLDAEFEINGYEFSNIATSFKNAKTVSVESVYTRAYNAASKALSLGKDPYSENNATAYEEWKKDTEKYKGLMRAAVIGKECTAKEFDEEIVKMFRGGEVAEITITVNNAMYKASKKLLSDKAKFLNQAEEGYKTFDKLYRKVLTTNIANLKAKDKDKDRRASGVAYNALAYLISKEAFNLAYKVYAENLSCLKKSYAQAKTIVLKATNAAPTEEAKSDSTSVNESYGFNSIKFV